MSENDALRSEFVADAVEMLENAEDALMRNEKKEIPLASCYSTIFNTLHSIKGAAKMFDFVEESKFVHQLESSFERYKGKTEMAPSDLDAILSGVTRLRERFLGKNVELKWEAKNPAVNPVESTPPTIKKEKTEIPTPEKKKTPRPDALRLLIVDDDPEFAQSLVDLFSDRFELVLASSVQEALSILNTDRAFESILSDVHMPQDKGTHLLEVLNTLNLKIPVVMMSNQADREDMIQMIRNKAFYFVDKMEGLGQVELALKKALWERMKVVQEENKRNLLKQVSLSLKT